MYVSIGNGKYIKQSEIVGIFDMDTATVCVATRNFLSAAQKERRLEIVDDDIPKSFVLVAQKERRGAGATVSRRGAKQGGVYLCKFSSGVLFSRSHRAGGITQGVEIEENGEIE